MSYSKLLYRRLRKPKSDQPPVPSHPHKYPKHDGAKGSVYNGVCNVTRCKSGAAVMFNVFTRGYYCRRCANGINWQPDKILCIKVDHDLTHEEMDYLYAEKSRRG